MIAPGTAILTSAQLAAELGIARSTLHQWRSEDARLAGCAVRQTKRSTWWSVQRLRDRGLLPSPETTAPVLTVPTSPANVARDCQTGATGGNQ